jgi:hypothetical protein
VDDVTAARLLKDLMAEVSFTDAIACVAVGEASKHQKEMRRYVREEQFNRAAISEACAREWEAILVAVKDFVRKYQGE